MADLKKAVEMIINSIPAGLIFDSHTVIALLMENFSDSYLAGFTGGNTESYHGLIAQLISGFENDKITKNGLSYSRNIRNKYSECSCWKKK